MEFFDKKEEVMDIALTRRGRELYAVGEFNPTYYAFADDEIIYESECVTGSNQTIILAASASFEGLAALNADNATVLTIVNADTTSVTFTTNNSKDEDASDADEIGTNLSAATTAIATKSLHVAFTAAIAAGTLKMDLYPATWTNETKIWLSQLGAGGPGLSAGGLTTITVPANISANGAGSGVNGPFTRTTRVKSGGAQKEVQNRSAQRIKDNMRVKLQTGTQSAMGIKNYVTSSIFEPHFRILGKSSRLDQEAPAWHVSAVNGRGVMSSSAHGLGPEGKPAVSFVPTELSGAVHGAGVNKAGVYKDETKTNEEMLTKYNKEIIPQINVFCDYNVKLVDVEKHLITDAEAFTQKVLETKFKQDKSLESEVALYNFKSELNRKYGGDIIMLLRKSTDDIVLDFHENNVDEGDFTLEVHKYRYGKTKDGASDNIKELEQLSFSEDEHGPDFVEYFFDISTDAAADIDLNIKYVLEAPMDLELEEESPLCADKITDVPGIAGDALDTMVGTQQKGESCKTSANCVGSLKCTNGLCTERIAPAQRIIEEHAAVSSTPEEKKEHDAAMAQKGFFSNNSVPEGGSCSADGHCLAGKDLKCVSKVGPNKIGKCAKKPSGKQCTGKKNGTKCGKGGVCNYGLCKEPIGSGM